MDLFIKLVLFITNDFIIINLFNIFIYMLWATQPNYNSPPENKSEITNNDQIYATTIKSTLNPGFYHIRYDEQYMPELF